jgi:hypothetical protein
MASLRHGFEEPGNAQDIRLVVDTIPTLGWSARPDGSAEFHNQRFGVRRKQLLERPDLSAASWVGRLFDYHRPLLGFNRSEQRVLAAVNFSALKCSVLN